MHLASKAWKVDRLGWNDRYSSIDSISISAIFLSSEHFGDVYVVDLKSYNSRKEEHTSHTTPFLHEVYKRRSKVSLLRPSTLDSSLLLLRRVFESTHMFINTTIAVFVAVPICLFITLLVPSPLFPHKQTSKHHFLPSHNASSQPKVQYPKYTKSQQSKH